MADCLLGSKMTYGIVYYIEPGDKPNGYLFQTAVALSSMDGVTDIPRTVICPTDTPQWWLDAVEAPVILIDKKDWSVDLRGKNEIWARRSFIVPDKTPYDSTVSLDVDIMWRKPLPEEAWATIGHHGLALGGLHDDPFIRGTWQFIRSLRWVYHVHTTKIVKASGSCMGFEKDHPKLQLLLREFRQLIDSPRGRLKNLEVPLALMAHRQELGYLGVCADFKTPGGNDRSVLHFNHRRYFRIPLWKPVFLKALAADRHGLKTHAARYKELTPLTHRFWPR
jgi:hypothetical protein